MRNILYKTAVRLIDCIEPSLDGGFILALLNPVQPRDAGELSNAVVAHTQGQLLHKPLAHVQRLESNLPVAARGQGETV